MRRLRRRPARILRPETGYGARVDPPLLPASCGRTGCPGRVEAGCYLLRSGVRQPVPLPPPGRNRYGPSVAASTVMSAGRSAGGHPDGSAAAVRGVHPDRRTPADSLPIWSPTRTACPSASWPSCWASCCQPPTAAAAGQTTQRTARRSDTSGSVGWRGEVRRGSPVGRFATCLGVQSVFWPFSAVRRRL
jgi:hypothetical protein